MTGLVGTQSQMNETDAEDDPGDVGMRLTKCSTVLGNSLKDSSSLN